MANSEEDRQDKPPVLGAWKNVYAAVVLYLAVVIALFWLFTQAYRK